MEHKIVDYVNILNLILPIALLVLFYAAYTVTRRASFLILILPSIYWFVMYVSFMYGVHFGVVDDDDYRIAFRILLWFIGLCLVVYALSEILAKREVNKSIDEVCNGKHHN